ncbi:hypothetical protein [Enterococcus phage 47]|nr:hypothetical protein [Enterococcus phage 47]
MLGDFLITLTTAFKRCFCKHDYVPHVQKGLVGVPYLECKKCGRVK